jgi:hypothetical protein
MSKYLAYLAPDYSDNVYSTEFNVKYKTRQTAFKKLVFKKAGIK